MTTTEDDTRGITVTETNGVTAPVESTTDRLDITLASKPLADVTLSILLQIQVKLQYLQVH